VKIKKTNFAAVISKKIITGGKAKFAYFAWGKDLLTQIFFNKHIYKSLNRVKGVKSDNKKIHAKGVIIYIFV
jgi:hypothetical protein